MITMATWEVSLQPSRHSTNHAESPVTLATPNPLPQQQPRGQRAVLLVCTLLLVTDSENTVYLLGLSLRLVLRARNGLCSWLSSNGRRALERKPWRNTKKRTRYAKQKWQSRFTDDYQLCPLYYRFLLLLDKHPDAPNWTCFSWTVQKFNETSLWRHLRLKVCCAVT